MATEICPHCKKERQARGFNLHVISCKAKTKMEPLRKMYANQIASMSPEEAERFLKKALEARGGR